MGEIHRNRVVKNVGEYLNRTKYVAQTIILFAYGMSGNTSTTPNRDRYLLEGDMLHILRYFRVVDGVFDAIRENVEPVALTALSLTSFKIIGAHYTYTLKGTAKADDDNKEPDNKAETNNDEDLLDELELGDTCDFIPLGGGQGTLFCKYYLVLTRNRTSLYNKLK